MSDERFEEYDRVTDVLSPFSGYGKIDPMILDRAAARGTRVHNAIHEIITDLGEWTDTGGIEGYLKSFSSFWDSHEPFVLQQEQRYFDVPNQLTGQVDLIAMVNKERVLVDWKTSSQYNCTWPLQGAAYANLLKAADMNVTKVIFVKLNKDGKDANVYDFEPAQYLEDFNKCLWAYRKFFRKMKIPTFED